MIALKSSAESPLEITRIAYPEGFTGELRTITPGHEFALTLRARSEHRATTGATAGSDAVVLYTTDGDEPVLTIPVWEGDSATAAGHGAAS
jgi:hypothetical protein